MAEIRAAFKLYRFMRGLSKAKASLDQTPIEEKRKPKIPRASNLNAFKEAIERRCWNGHNVGGRDYTALHYLGVAAEDETYLNCPECDEFTVVDNFVKFKWEYKSWEELSGLYLLMLILMFILWLFNLQDTLGIFWWPLWILLSLLIVIYGRIPADSIRTTFKRKGQDVTLGTIETWVRRDMTNLFKMKTLGIYGFVLVDKFDRPLSPRETYAADALVLLYQQDEWTVPYTLFEFDTDRPFDDKYAELVDRLAETWFLMY